MQLSSGRSSDAFWAHWHFWIGFAITPILWVSAATGLIQLFRSEIEAEWYRDILMDRVALAAKSEHSRGDELQMLFEQRLSSGYFQRVLDIAEREFSSQGWVVRLEFEHRRMRLPSVLVAPADRPWPQKRVYIDPDHDRIAGSLPDQNLFTLALELHRNLMAGRLGRWAIELTASWIIVSIFIGIRIARRNRRSSPTPHSVTDESLQEDHRRELAQAAIAVGHQRWRSSHLWAGLMMAPLIVLILWNGLQFSELYGTMYHGIARATGQYDYLLERPRSIPSSEPRSTASLDRLLLRALSHGMDWQRIAIQRPKAADDSFTIECGADLPPSMTQTMYFDQTTAELLKHFTMLELGPLAQWNKWSYPMHVGSIGGIWTKCLWGVAVVLLAMSPVTACGMTASRWRQGKSIVPTRVGIPSWRTRYFLIALGLLLPAVGISFLGLAAGGLLLARWRRSSNPSPESRA